MAIPPPAINQTSVVVRDAIRHKVQGGECLCAVRREWQQMVHCSTSLPRFQKCRARNLPPFSFPFLLIILGFWDKEEQGSQAIVHVLKKKKVSWKMFAVPRLLLWLLVRHKEACFWLIRMRAKKPRKQEENWQFVLCPGVGEEGGRGREKFGEIGKPGCGRQKLSQFHQAEL